MLLGVEGSYSDDVLQEEAANMMESYIEGEDYSSQIQYSDVDPEELKYDLIEAVDDVRLSVSKDGRGVLLKTTGALSGSIGAAGLVVGNPLGFVPMALGVGQYFAGSQRDYYSSNIEEIETKAFLQDMMYDSLEVSGENDGYEIKFEYLEG